MSTQRAPVSKFQKATKKQSRLRLALIGPSGSGKTYSALAIATAMLKLLPDAKGQRIAVIDTERGSASKYSDAFDFDVLELDTFSPTTYVQAIKDAEAAGYAVCIIDSLSHAWMGREGALEQVDKFAKRSQSGNTFNAWREVTPMHHQLVDAMLRSSMHIMATMRTKTEYVVEKDERTGRSAPRKIGLAPVQRDGLEYEFDVVADMNPQNEMVVSKTRCPALNGLVQQKPGAEVAAVLAEWLGGEKPAPVVELVKDEAQPADSGEMTIEQQIAHWAKLQDDAWKAPDQGKARGDFARAIKAANPPKEVIDAITKRAMAKSTAKNMRKPTVEAAPTTPVKAEEKRMKITCEGKDITPAPEGEGEVQS